MMLTRSTTARVLAAACLAGALALCTAPASWARVEVADSPLYGRLLTSAMNDLRAPATASPAWRVAAEKAVDLLVASPAYAGRTSVLSTVDPGQPTFCQGGVQKCLTAINEPTLCWHGGKNDTQCDKENGNKNSCTATVQSQQKTDCNAAPDKSVCKDGGTRCPGNGAKNECHDPTLPNGPPLTVGAPNQHTKCDNADATLCRGDATRCAKDENNQCLTWNNGTKKTACKDGHDHATLCHTEETGCSSKGKNVCHTAAQGTHDKTACTSSNNPTKCNEAGTSCTGDDIDQTCDYYNLCLAQPRMFPNDPSALIEVDAPLGYFASHVGNISFSPPGPVLLEPPTFYDDQTAVYYVNLPPNAGGVEQLVYNVQVTNGITPILPNSFMATPVIAPASSTVGLIALVLILALFGTSVLLRRKPEDQQA